MGVPAAKAELVNFIGILASTSLSVQRECLMNSVSL
jgi:hypothetical protein